MPPPTTMMADDNPNIQSWLPLAPLGRGSSALVSLALSLHPNPGRLFALKSPLLSSADSLNSLTNELRLLLPLSSPFLVRCFGAHFLHPTAASATPRALFLEFMDGGSLSDLLNRSVDRRLPLPLVRRYTRSIVHGLHHLHSHGIVHCDIKGQNILIGSSGVKIADFGAAKRLDAEKEEDAQSSESAFKGTPLWMAPEVVRGLEQGFPSDIWSLGCTVVELIQGRPPWGHISDMAAALYKLGCSEEAPPLPYSISDDARDFLLHCLQRDPKARWTAAELLQHPFLCDIPEEEDEAKHGQCSPRSILDFSASNSDSEDGSDVGTVPSLLAFHGGSAVAKRQEDDSAGSMPSQLPIPRSTKRQHSDAFDSEEREWITVKRAASSNRREQKVPFIKSAKQAHVHVTRGCDVSLESAMFLKNRKIVG